MTVFLSYSTKDYFFAELLQIKLKEAGIKLWRDKGSLIAGTDWRNGIEKGISNCQALVIALSQSSSQSAYVTYEWAYALGNGRTVIPVKITQCEIHPRLEAIQYLDFTIPNSLPWDLLVERIKESEDDIGINSSETITESSQLISNQNNVIETSILNYLNQRGFQMASFDRLRLKIDPSLTDKELNEIIDNSIYFGIQNLKAINQDLLKEYPNDTVIK